MNTALSYTLADGFYTFVFSNGKRIIPQQSVILVDDGTDMLAVKAVATRKVLFLCKKN